MMKFHLHVSFRIWQKLILTFRCFWWISHFVDVDTAVVSSTYRHRRCRVAHYPLFFSSVSRFILSFFHSSSLQLMKNSFRWQSHQWDRCHRDKRQQQRARAYTSRRTIFYFTFVDIGSEGRTSASFLHRVEMWYNEAKVKRERNCV